MKFGPWIYVLEQVIGYIKRTEKKRSFSLKISDFPRKFHIFFPMSKESAQFLQVKLQMGKYIGKIPNCSWNGTCSLDISTITFERIRRQSAMGIEWSRRNEIYLINEFYCWIETFSILGVCLCVSVFMEIFPLTSHWFARNGCCCLEFVGSGNHKKQTWLQWKYFNKTWQHVPFIPMWMCLVALALVKHE